jgi:flavin-binding protein dodecin
MTERTRDILREIERKGSSHRSIAAAYRLGIYDCRASGDLDRVEWAIVNAAIDRRYRPSALNKIKKLAWSRKELSVCEAGHR